jgi:DNA-binding response OmpR family regulator
MEPGGSTATVLIVEDDAELLGAMSEALQDAGYLVVSASDGAAALVMLRSVNVSLVVSDLAMPGMDGLELIEASASNPESASIPIIMMTGSERVETAPAGCVAVLSKPFSLGELMAMVGAYARRN